MDNSNKTIISKRVTADDIEVIRNGSIEDAIIHLQNLLDSVHQTAVMHSLLGFPDTVRLIYKNREAMIKMRDEFYVKNPAVQEHYEKFAEEVSIIENLHPEWPIQKLMEVAAQNVKTRLAAQKVNITPERGDSDKINSVFGNILDSK